MLLYSEIKNNGHTFKLCWDDCLINSKMSINSVMNECDKKNEDWRLPTILELYSIIDTTEELRIKDFWSIDRCCVDNYMYTVNKKIGIVKRQVSELMNVLLVKNII